MVIKMAFRVDQEVEQQLVHLDQIFLVVQEWLARAIGAETDLEKQTGLE
jgi:hypothetical protein